MMGTEQHTIRVDCRGASIVTASSEGGDYGHSHQDLSGEEIDQNLGWRHWSTRYLFVSSAIALHEE